MGRKNYSSQETTFSSICVGARNHSARQVVLLTVKGMSIDRGKWLALTLLVACTTTDGYRTTQANHIPPTSGVVRAGVTVPDVVGSDFRTVTQELLAADLQFRGVECAVNEAKCRFPPPRPLRLVNVTRQLPKAGRLIPPGTVVSLSYLDE
jgi:hypothetical protein